MRVKDILNTVNEWHISPELIWYLDENREVKGNIKSWTYIDGELIGHAQPLYHEGYVNYLYSINEFIKTVKQYNVPWDTEVFVDVPTYGELQRLSNYSYDRKSLRFSSEVYWEKRL